MQAQPFNQMTVYGSIPPDRIDVRARACLSVDLRRETGAAPNTPDESRVVPPGTFTLSVFGVVGDGPPIGEIRCMVNDIEISIVGHLTGRSDVVEITPDHIAAAMENDEYRLSVLAWLGLVS